MQGSVININKGEQLDRDDLLRRLVNQQYVRNDMSLERGEFRVKGDTVDIAMAYSDKILRVTFWDDGKLNEEEYTDWQGDKKDLLLSGTYYFKMYEDDSGSFKITLKNNCLVDLSFDKSYQNDSFYFLLNITLIIVKNNNPITTYI